MMLKFLAVLVTVIGISHGVPVDNGVTGEPEIECGPDSLTVNFNTLNEFEGHVYVKGLYSEEGLCRSSGDTGRQVAGISVQFSECGTLRQRSLNPRGVFVSTTIIITFHPLFITKVDRAFRIQCFYMEADKTVSTDLEVSMLTTDFKTQQVPMPICRYDIFESEDSNELVQFAEVGQSVYHKWSCDTETENTFCMVIYSCFVTDKNDQNVDLIDEEGCALDRYLLNNPEYTADLTAGVEAHVFKYADRADLYFQCQIAIHVKEPGEECPRPSCPTPPGRGAGQNNPSEEGPALNVDHPWPLQPGSPYLPESRSKRSATSHPAGVLDVVVELETLELEAGLDRQQPDFSSLRKSEKRESEGICLSTTALSVLLTMGTALILSVIGISACLLLRRTKA